MYGIIVQGKNPRIRTTPILKFDQITIVECLLSFQNLIPKVILDKNCSCSIGFKIVKIYLFRPEKALFKAKNVFLRPKIPLKP